MGLILVVRCKDCKHRSDPIECPMCHEEIFDDDGYNEYYLIDQTEEEGFCHKGEYQEDYDYDERAAN